MGINSGFKGLSWSLSKVTERIKQR